VKHPHAGNAHHRVPATGATSPPSQHNWGDSNFYVRADEAISTVTVEHRAARAPDPFRIRLAEVPTVGAALELVPAGQDEVVGDGPESLEDEIEKLLKTSTVPLGLTEIHTSLRKGRNRVSEALGIMVEAGTIEREGRGFRLRTVPSST
jgi:hypothetical protein